TSSTGWSPPGPLPEAAPGRCRILLRRSCSGIARRRLPRSRTGCSTDSASPRPCAGTPSGADAWRSSPTGRGAAPPRRPAAPSRPPCGRSRREPAPPATRSSPMRAFATSQSPFGWAPAPSAPRSLVIPCTPPERPLGVWTTSLGRQEALPCLHPSRDLGLEALLGRLVETSTRELVGKVLLIRDPSFLRMSVLVARTVAKALHERGRSVANDQRRRQAAAALALVHGVAEPLVDGVALGRRREIDRALSERQLAFGSAELVVGLEGRHRQRQSLRIGVADVLAGEANQAAGHVERILAGRQHARQPVEAGVRVGVAQRLVERRDQVVVLLARPVVAQVLARQRVAHIFGRHPRTAAFGGAGLRRRRRDLERIERASRVSV